MFLCLPTNSQGIIMSKKIKLEDTDFKQQRQRYFPSKHSLPNLKKKKTFMESMQHCK